jgi:hypothetical protein
MIGPNEAELKDRLNFRTPALGLEISSHPENHFETDEDEERVGAHKHRLHGGRCVPHARPEHILSPTEVLKFWHTPCQ